MLPYSFNFTGSDGRNIPMLYFNEKNAAVKLLNCIALGTSSVSIMPQFDGSRGNRTSFPPEEYDIYRKAVLGIQKKLEKDPRTKDMSWTPILYEWEIYGSYATHECDWSQLVWTDSTVSRFLLVDLRPSVQCNCCDELNHREPDEWLQLSAQRFLNLLTYLPLPNPPKWIRATYTTPERRELPDVFFDFDSGAHPVSAQSAKTFRAPIYHLRPSQLVPSLTPTDLTAINCVLLHKGKTVPGDAVRKKVLAPPEKYAELRYATRHPEFSAAALETFAPEVRRMCNGCEEIDLISTRMRCGGCKMVMYCSTQCQKKAWPTHKQNCMPR